MRIVFLFLFVILTTCIFSQYSGGQNDGYDGKSSITQNTLPSIYKGGANDGFHSAASIKLNEMPGIYTGGKNDGFNIIIVNNQNALPGIYAGGLNDGFAMFAMNSQNQLPAIYTGGNNDGFATTNSSVQNILPNIYKGGANDGWGVATDQLVFIFTGSGNWSDAANWLNNLIPPATLPQGHEIIINPSAGSCILDVSQTISTGSKLTIAVGKSLIVPGDLLINN